jgi:hypothetical protein
METPWRQVKNSKSRRQEERLAKVPGGRKQINSGRFWHSRRDAKIRDFLIEARGTDSESYSISQKEFEQIAKQAVITPPGMLPAIQIDFSRVKLWVMKLDDHLYREQLIQNLIAEVERLRGGDDNEAE